MNKYIYLYDSTDEFNKDKDQINQLEYFIVYNQEEDKIYLKKRSEVELITATTVFTATKLLTND